MLKQLSYVHLVCAAVVGPVGGASAEPRLALVIGEGAYRGGELPA